MYRSPPPTDVMTAPNIKKGAKRPNAVRRPPEQIMKRAVMASKNKGLESMLENLLIESIRGKFRTPLSDAETPCTDWKYIAKDCHERSSHWTLYDFNLRR